MSNRVIAEWLMTAAAEASGHLPQTFKRAARAAFLWPEEAADLVAQSRSLTQLDGIGPFLEKKIQAWVLDPPPRGEIDELRADFLTLVEARNILAREPSWSQSLRGDLQMHTTWSDGSGSVADMAASAAALGHEYIAITDHTKGLKIAGGINEEQLEEQGREIQEVNERAGREGRRFTVLRAAELNLNPKGEGDMDSAALAALELVLGSFHSALRRVDDQTERYLAAVRNPHLHILGHPQGRIYGYRAGLSADWSRVFDEAAHLDKAVEIDAYPDRQDLRVDLLELARGSGVRISIGTDAHHASQLSFIELGLAAALQAGIARDRILNFLPVDELRAWAASVRA